MLLDGPVLVCHDGSEGSLASLRQGSRALHGGDMVVLSAWQPLLTQLALTGSFEGVGALEGMDELDAREEAAARDAAVGGARLAQDAGFDAVARVERAEGRVVDSIIRVADELDAGLILCGTRGRGSLRSALLGSTSHGLLAHARRPVLVSPVPDGPD